MSQDGKVQLQVRTASTTHKTPPKVKLEDLQLLQTEPDDVLVVNTHRHLTQAQAAIARAYIADILPELRALLLPPGTRTQLFRPRKGDLLAVTVDSVNLTQDRAAAMRQHIEQLVPGIKVVVQGPSTRFDLDRRPGRIRQWRDRRAAKKRSRADTAKDQPRPTLPNPGKVTT